MAISISLLLQFIGLFTSVKVLNINLKLIGVILLTLIPSMATYFISGNWGMIVALVSFVLIIKLFDNATDFFKIIAIIIVSASIQLLTIKLADQQIAQLLLLMN